jgi:hypothetical protein
MTRSSQGLFGGGSLTRQVQLVTKPGVLTVHRHAAVMEIGRKQGNHHTAQVVAQARASQIAQRMAMLQCGSGDIADVESRASDGAQEFGGGDQLVPTLPAFGPQVQRVVDPNYVVDDPLVGRTPPGAPMRIFFARDSAVIPASEQPKIDAFKSGPDRTVDLSSSALRPRTSSPQFRPCRPTGPAPWPLRWPRPARRPRPSARHPPGRVRSRRAPSRILRTDRTCASTAPLNCCGLVRRR